MRRILAVGLVCVGAASAASPPRVISSSGVRITVPAEWHAVASKTPRCDPERLLVVSSAPLRIRPGGRLAEPRSSAVLVLLLEDRYVQDRPVGDLRRPARFFVEWNDLARIKPDCGLPNAPAFMRYFTAHGRYLGFIVYPGAGVSAATRAETLAVMDSLRVGA